MAFLRLKEIGMDKKFELEHQYQLYLQRVGLKESAMHPVQKRQIKQAFIGGIGQMLILLRDDVGAIEDEDEAVKVMESLLNQVGDYFLNINNQQN
jgi:hypothetical protein